MTKISVKIDTHNSQTIKNFNDIGDAIKFLLTRCTADERQKIFGSYGKDGGTDKLPFHCDNDE